MCTCFTCVAKLRAVSQHVNQGAGWWEGTPTSKESFRNNFLNTGKNRTLLPMNRVISEETAKDLCGALDLINHACSGTGD